MTTTRKSMLNLTFSLGGVIVLEGGGEGEFLDITSPEQFGAKTGVHGDVVFFDTPNNVYELTVTLLETSPFNAALQGVLQAQKLSSVSGPSTLVINDIGTQERFTGQAMITKEPDRKKAAEATNYVWKILASSREGFQYQGPTPIIPT